MRATANETAEEIEICIPKRRSEAYKNWFAIWTGQEDRECIIGREGSNKIETSEAESLVSMQGQGFKRQGFIEYINILI